MWGGVRNLGQPLSDDGSTGPAAPRTRAGSAFGVLVLRTIMPNSALGVVRMIDFYDPRIGSCSFAPSRPLLAKEVLSHPPIDPVLSKNVPVHFSLVNLRFFFSSLGLPGGVRNLGQPLSDDGSTGPAAPRTRAGSAFGVLVL